MEKNPKYKRVLIKLSGEFLKDKEEALSFQKLNSIVSEIKYLHSKKVEMGVVIGGGNILRGLEGREKFGVSQEDLDEIGMIATLVNGSLISLFLKKMGIPAVVLSSIPISPSIGEIYNKRKARELLEESYVLIFVGGTGNPYFTTDTAAVLRALQIEADILLKVTNVDGVYDKDPNKFPEAKFYKEITYKEALERGLEIMDLTAFSLAREYKLPIVVFNGEKKDNLKSVIMGKEIGTIVKGG
ncbi:MAG: UMP kinase [candidate division WOR-3 bacterium]